MTEVIEKVGVGTTDSMEVADEERKCPKCGKPWTKLEPTLAQVRAAVQTVLASFEKDVLALDPEAKFGYTGSVASGQVGNPKKVHFELEPDIRGECGTKYDVDGFIISEKLCGKIKKVRGKRWGSRDKAVSKLESSVRSKLGEPAALAHIEGGKKRYSIVVYCPNETHKVVAKKAVFIF